MTSRHAAWQRGGTAAALGAIAAFGQAPYDLPQLLILSLALTFHFFRTQITKRQAALFGWAFGIGYFAHALQWIVSPFMVDVARHGWMAPFAVLFLAAGLALFWALAFWAARVLSSRGVWPLLLTLPAVELLRAYVFTGFPWAMYAQTIIDTPMAPLLAVVGPHGVNVLLVAAGMLLIARGNPFRQLAFGGSITLVYLLVFQILGPVAPTSALTDHTIRLIQPNAAQRDKWDPEQIPIFFDRQLQLTAAPALDEGPRPDLVLWSETAIPWVLDRADAALDQIALAGADAQVALGVQRRDEGGYYNSMVALDPAGDVAQTYDKHHLVPFGEYMPFGDLLSRFDIYGIAARANFGYATGPGAELMDFGPLGRALPLICYEAVFSHDVNAAPTRPDFLIQITNDAWFGKGAGPRQHLAQARMRAIEQGLPLARSANTGISAMIDPYGRILAALPLNEAGFVDALLPVALAPTLYSRTGDVPISVLLLVGLAFCAIRSRKV
ncbi:MAG: apolipoprotein N-acyltransferase [Sulfitobacter sp.]